MSSEFAEAVKTQVRFLDNVLDVTVWPLGEQSMEAQNKRRIGVGFTGLANALAMLGLVYHEIEGLKTAQHITELMRDTAYLASIELAIEKGAYPLLNVDSYLKEGTCASRLPEYLKQKIEQHGIRNSHLLSIAPTGTVSLAFADNASNGIEPPFALAYTRKKRMADGSHQFYNVLDHAFRVYLSTLEDQDYAKALEEAVVNFQPTFQYYEKTLDTRASLPKCLVTANEMTAEQHLSMMRVVQPFIDTSISKTVNVPADYPFEDFAKIYDIAWSTNLKGVSTYRPNNILGSVLSTDKPKEEKKEEPNTPLTFTGKITGTLIDSTKTYEQWVETLYTRSFPSRKDGLLQGVSVKGRFFTNQGEQKFIITINFTKVEEVTQYGLISVNRPVEFLLTSNFAQSSSAWDASMRFMSLMARSGVPIPKIIENLKEITWEHGGVRYGTKLKDGQQIPLWHDSDAAAIGHAIQEALILCGYLKEDGKVNYPVQGDDVKVTTVLANSSMSAPVESQTDSVQSPVVNGKKCDECGAHAVIKVDGCTRCTSCNAIGSCG
jgi:ribonucleoside-diphosphate reductase alpha chain